jgi:hypothetical protein
MEFIKIYLFCFLTSLCIFSYGYSLNKTIFKFQIKNIIEYVLIGIIFLSFLALFLNFFVSLNLYINTLIFFIGFCLLFLFKESIDLEKTIKKISIVSLIGFVVFLLDNSNRPDAGLYHLPYISMLNEEKIIIGSVNLHYRFGFISSLQYLFSIFNNFILGDNGILIPLTIIFPTILIYFYEEFKIQKENILKLFSIFALVFILTAMNRYSGFGNDDPAHMFYLLSIYNILKFFVSKKNSQSSFAKITLFTSYTFLIKQFYILILIFPFLIFITNLKKINLFNSSNIFTFFFISFWIFKNVLVSSCLLYPVNFTCINSLEWSPSNTQWEAKKANNEGEAWAKGWPDRIDKSKNFSKYLSDYKWINVWKKNHLKIIIKKLTPITLFSILIIIYYLLKFNINNKIIKNKFLSHIFFVNLLLLIIWFFKFPLYRFGAGYLVTTIILINLIFLQNLEIKDNLKKNVFIVLLLICTVVIVKHFNRIYKNFDKQYVDYPWPKKNSFTNKNQKNTNLPIMQDNEIIYYVSSPYPLCMHSKAPCTTFRNLNLERKKYPGNYKILVVK